MFDVSTRLTLPLLASLVSLAAAGSPDGPDGADTGHMPVETTLVPRGAIWRYLDDDSDPGRLWTTRGFDDSGWDSGAAQLGYGDGDEITIVDYGADEFAKYITTYFRHTFSVTDAAGFRRGCIALLRDDGAAVYLNGVEVVRSNLPGGTIHHRTKASRSVSGAEEDEYLAFSLDPALLVEGENVVAVEIHQRSASSSDISFDFGLTASDDPTPIVRGPYLQRTIHDRTVVRWRTCVPKPSFLWLGSDPTSLNLWGIDPVSRADHEVEITGLSPSTVYYYGVGDENGILAGGDADHRFRTAPLPGTSQPTRIWAIGDSGSADFHAAAVRDGYLRFAGSQSPDVFLMLGDNAYPNGTDDEYQRAVFEMYPNLLRQSSVWPTLGNHDETSADSPTESGVYYDIFSLPRDGAGSTGLPSGTEAYYSFDRGDIHFVCLDSQDTDRTAAGAMMAWLDADLRRTTARWTIAFWHHPPYSKGTHDSDDPTDSGGRMRDMREVALPILEALGVDLVLAGHSHSYERSYLLDGHYGTSNTLAPAMILDLGDGQEQSDGRYVKSTNGRAPHEGAVYIVAGCASSVVPGPLDHPAMHVAIDQLGSVVIDIDGDRLDAKFLDYRGVVEDSFTIVKGDDRTLTRVEPRVSLTVGGAQNLKLDAGSEHAGRSFLLVGSFGTLPGMDIDGVHLPLNFDLWFDFSLQAVNSIVFQNTQGVLDRTGQATARIEIPAITDPNVLGFATHHAYVVYDFAGLHAASNPIRLLFER